MFAKARATGHDLAILVVRSTWPCSQGCSTDTQSCENVRQEKNQTMKKQSAEMLELEAGAVLCFV